MSEQGDKTEYKGSMRLPVELHRKLEDLSNLTKRSLNDLIVEAADFLCTLAENYETAAVLPESVVAARAVRLHRGSPSVVALAACYGDLEHVGKIHQHLRGASESEELARVAEEPPPPPKAQPRRASAK